ncbi:MAG: hypothetical protein EXR92_02650 [Gemmatimonadetes bacterium]|nr:hypothetical protein [Gemmatimonadota bacterium]
MDFFEAQEEAVVRSRTLFFLFLCAVLSMIAVVYATALVVLGVGFGGSGGWLHPDLLAVVAGGMIAVIGMGAAIRTAQLRKGGSAVAGLLGGIRVRSDTRDPAERRLLNVVEEMSIASGVPVPAVFVLGDENGINAFAAGHTIHDAAVAVTRGSLESLTRDELQGVVAHEFSHILNGDMRLNVRLMGLLYGILLLTIAGRVLAQTGGRRGRDRAGQIALVGVVLILLGYLGVLFGRLIQAAVSRQREFLADASAVQFTRSRDGIAGALKKIGGKRGSRIRDAHAAEAEHFFLAQGAGAALAGILATHPPVSERIRRIDPAWDGRFQDADAKLSEPVSATSDASVAAPSAVAGFSERSAPDSRPSVPAFLGSIGTLGAASLLQARGFVERVPQGVREAIRTPPGASDLVCALLLSHDPDLRKRQLEIVAASRGAGEAEDALEMWDAIEPLGSEARLPLLDLALPALREVSAGESAALQVTVSRLIRADGRVLPFEFALFHILQRHLPSPGTQRLNARRGHLELTQLRREAQIVLSVVARAGSIPEDGTDEAMELDLDRVDEALERLRMASPRARKGILEAAVEAALGDGRFRPAEVEVVRAIAEALDVPVPPIARGPAA